MSKDTRLAIRLSPERSVEEHINFVEKSYGVLTNKSYDKPYKPLGGMDQTIFFYTAPVSALRDILGVILMGGGLQMMNTCLTQTRITIFIARCL